MSHLELESLLSYEHNLAACYEAEYLLQLSMQREHISEGVASNWARYEDTSEARVMASQPLPPLSVSPSLTLAHSRATNSPAEGMDAHNSHVPAQYATFLNGTPMTATGPHHNSHWHSLSPTRPLTSANPLHINSLHCTNGLPQYSHTGEPVSLKRTECHPSLSLPECFVTGGGDFSSMEVCQSEAHSDGPQRKKMCLQRPEM